MTAKTNQERSAERRKHENEVAQACGYPTARKLLTAMIAAHDAGFTVAVVLQNGPRDMPDIMLSDAAELIQK